MNRLILIGNGFDLAHGMKTSYNDFILWYLKKCFEEAYRKGSYSDKLIQIVENRGYGFGSLKNIDGFIEHFYKTNFNDFESKSLQVAGDFSTFANPFNIRLNSSLLRNLLSNCSNVKWVEIENEFYSQLKDIFTLDIGKESGSAYEERNTRRLNTLTTLNESLQIIIKELEIYLSTIEPDCLIESYKSIFNSVIKEEDILIENNLPADEEPIENLILNFNYTSTPEMYFDANQLGFNINYIHGKIDSTNKLIFGFGDELDSDYPKLELQKANAFFEYIKSFWYFKTSNYHNLVRFIDEEEFQVYILGHSCGLSDRTMLNMIFEHENCKSIKIFYHGTKEKNNFTNLTQEISRHFRDKAMMRKKIVPFDKSEPMPQVESN